MLAVAWLVLRGLAKLPLPVACSGPCPRRPVSILTTRVDGSLLLKLSLRLVCRGAVWSGSSVSGGLGGAVVPLALLAVDSLAVGRLLLDVVGISVEFVTGSLPLLAVLSRSGFTDEDATLTRLRGIFTMKVLTESSGRRTWRASGNTTSSPLPSGSKRGLITGVSVRWGAGGACDVVEAEVACCEAEEEEEEEEKEEGDSH